MSADFGRALDTCLDLHLLDDVPDPSMHQLFAAFLRETTPPEGDRAGLRKVREAQWSRFVELAEAVDANPADTQKAAALIGYPLTQEAWVAIGLPYAIEEVKGTSTVASTIKAWASACMTWVIVCRAQGNMRKPVRGTSAR